MSIVEHIIQEDLKNHLINTDSSYTLLQKESEKGLADVVRQMFREYFEAHREDEVKKANLYECVLKEIEKPLIEECLRITEGNQKRASEILGLNRNTLRKKMGLLDIAIEKE